MAHGHRGPNVDFDAAYARVAPWDIGRPQPALLRLAESGSIHGRVLDVGCGTGEHALMAAALGLEATGVDSSVTAVGLAQRKAEERHLAARFLVWDALDLPSLKEQFDTVIDSALFHIFGDDDRGRYVESLRAAIPPGGRYFMLCFSDRVPGDVGPRRVTQNEIRACFRRGWTVRSIEAATMEVTFTPAGVSAWLSTIDRTSEGGGHAEPPGEDIGPDRRRPTPDTRCGVDRPGERARLGAASRRPRQGGPALIHDQRCPSRCRDRVGQAGGGAGQDGRRRGGSA